MFTVTPIPAFNDNYIWALQTNSDDIVVVDPGDANAVLTYLTSKQLNLAAILITHHHQDHTGGVKTLVEQYGIEAYGPANSPYRGISKPLNDGDSISILGETLTISAVPGHTLDHISYYNGEGDGQLFCGDTLFLAGCGRLFEGTASQMLTAMQLFKSLPGSTAIYCTHEYSLANLAFAAAVEPENADIAKATTTCKELRQANRPTLPSKLATELRINPFMRTNTDSVKHAANQFSGQVLPSEQQVFAAIREWKNQF